MAHDDQTEVLTRTGWKLFVDVAKDDELAGIDPTTMFLVYAKQQRLVRFQYNGQLIRGFHRNMDFRVTPDHKMAVRPWNQKSGTLCRDCMFCAAKDLGWYSGLLTRIKWEGGKIASDHYMLPGINTQRRSQRENILVPMSMWLRFLGIYLAEGTLAPRDYKEHRIQIAAVKPRERLFVIEALRAIGIETSHNRSDRFTFTNHRLYETIRTLGLQVRAPHKFVPSFVFEQSASAIREFLLGHFSGDGGDNGAGFRRHYTSSKQLAEDLQRLIFLSGDESYVRTREPREATTKDGRKVVGRYPEHSVSVCGQRASSIDRAKHITEEAYTGVVFCAEVATLHTLVTRRKGCILISGNSSA
jgi:replicative DNA helicase Mcm